MQSDAEVFHLELERSLGSLHWEDPHWKPHPVPRWIQDVLENEMSRVKELTQTESEWTTQEARIHWIEWANQISQKLTDLMADAETLFQKLDKKDFATASEIFPKWVANIEDWKRQLQWGGAEYERSLRQNFAATESRVVELRTGLEVIILIVVLLSLLLLWLAERALRPVAELTDLARDIARRGLRKQDKSLLPRVPISRSDEVSQLAREFHHMATALLEREKTVESQKKRLQEQNRLLREMGEFNQNILNSIESVLIVTDLHGKVTQCNPGALRWLGISEEENVQSVEDVMGSDVKSLTLLQSILEKASGSSQWIERLKQTPETWKIGPIEKDKRVYGGHVMPLRQEEGQAHGVIIVLDDLTEEVGLQERLRQAENLAAIGRMSAQVAHEVRNPLHSIGLEAEMAADMASRLGDPNLKQSLQSILASVDRLQKITENYLKLSRLSEGKRRVTDVGEVLESVLATYSPVCEVQGVKVEWRREPAAFLKISADRELIEQVLGNLFRNSLQALESSPKKGNAPPTISWSLGNTESAQLWLRIEDNGPGIVPEVRERLFTPFFTTRAQGTGLGLSFIKKVVEDHGGMIRNRDRPVGQGACFEVILPLKESLRVNTSFRAVASI
jgi:nitrogen fixation/metabolism regulation signal transduction histidine kinase